MPSKPHEVFFNQFVKLITHIELPKEEQDLILHHLKGSIQKNLQTDLDEMVEQIHQLAEDVNLGTNEIEQLHQVLEESPELAKEIFSELWKVKQKFDRVSLETINFNWEGSSPVNSGLPISHDFSGWVKDRASCVAYSLSETQETVAQNKLQIHARFYTPDPETRIQIRTRKSPIYLRDLATGQLIQNREGKEALGNVKPTTVFFNKETGYSIYRGRSSFVPLTLEGVNFPDLGVGVYDIHWQWEFRVLDMENKKWEEKWHPCNVTKHRVFIVLKAPHFPWTSNRFPDLSSGPPYPLSVDINALYHACIWAQGCKTIDEAAQAIVRNLFDSGKFSYHTNSSYYQEVRWKSERSDKEVLLKNFYWSKVAERLNGGFGLGRKVNCLDCAFIVSTLANALGANLRVGKLQGSPLVDFRLEGYSELNRFAIRPIRAIGHKNEEETMSILKSEDRYYFTFHAVAWQPALDELGEEIDEFNNKGIRIYDACLQFFVDDCGKVDYIAPGGMEFGTDDPNDKNKYLQRLSIEGPEGQNRCIPQSTTTMRPQLK